MAKWPYNTARWRKLRQAKLMDKPLCEYCPPHSRQPANVVDHRKPISDGGDPWAWDNLASCCRSCHNRKTAAKDGGFGHKRSGKPLKGCDADGMPLDSSHWWHSSEG